MAYETYDLGDLVRVSASFTDPLDNDAPLDPTTVKLSVKDPSGAVTTYTYGESATIVRDAVGEYHADISATLPGDWYYRWHSTGTGQAAEECKFEITPAEAM